MAAYVEGLEVTSGGEWGSTLRDLEIHPARCWEIHFVWTPEGANCHVFQQEESVMGNFKWCCSVYIYIYIYYLCVHMYIIIYIEEVNVAVYAYQYTQHIFRFWRTPRRTIACWQSISCQIFAWFHQHGMRDFPWRCSCQALVFALPKVARDTQAETKLMAPNRCQTSWLKNPKVILLVYRGKPRLVRCRISSINSMDVNQTSWQFKMQWSSKEWEAFLKVDLQWCQLPSTKGIKYMP